MERTLGTAGLERAIVIFAADTVALEAVVQRDLEGSNNELYTEVAGKQIGLWGLMWRHS